MKTDISEKKPAEADFSAKDSAKNPAGKPAGKKPTTSRSGSRVTAKSFAGKPASRLKSGEATAPAETPAASRSGGTAKTREYPAKVKEPKTTRADGAAKSTPAAKKPKASTAEQKPIATAPAVPADETAFLKTLGLAARARQTVMGTDMVCDALAEGRVRLVVEAGDTSENTHKRLTDKCITYRTPHVRLLSDGGTLGAALGKSGALAVCGVTGEIARSLFSAWERLTASAPAVPEKVAKTKK